MAQRGRDAGPLNGVRFVLVRPRNPLNIGAAARALANFGFSDLFVADTHPPVWEEAKTAAPQGQGVLDQARAGTLEEAVAGCSVVLATSAKRRRLPLPLVPLPGLTKWLAARSGKIAVLLGSEKTGLTNAELSRCQALVRIPTSAEAPSMNLGQAAALIAYELSRASLPRRTQAAPAEAPNAAQQEAFTRLMLSAMDAQRYAPGVPAQNKAARIRRMLGALTRQDLALLQAVLRRVAQPRRNAMHKAALAAVLAVLPADASARALSQLQAQAPETEAPPSVRAARPQSAPATSANACYERALAELKLTPFGAVSLCSGALSADAPLACYKQGLAANLTPAGSVLLCSGSPSDEEPAACYRAALRKNLTALGAVTLCHAAPSAETRLSCWDSALAQHLTGHGAVELCGGIPVDLIKQIYGNRQSGDSLPPLPGLTVESSPAP